MIVGHAFTIACREEHIANRTHTHTWAWHGILVQAVTRGPNFIIRRDPMWKAMLPTPKYHTNIVMPMSIPICRNTIGMHWHTHRHAHLFCGQNVLLIVADNLGKHYGLKLHTDVWARLLLTCCARSTLYPCQLPFRFLESSVDPFVLTDSSSNPFTEHAEKPHSVRPPWPGQMSVSVSSKAQRPDGESRCSRLSALVVSRGSSRPMSEAGEILRKSLAT